MLKRIENVFWIAAATCIWPPGGAVVAGIFAWIAFALLLGPAHCRDGWASPSIGLSGACSWHGGVERNGGVAFAGGCILALFAWAWLNGRAQKREKKRVEEQRKRAGPE